jgi:hypothetical protein
LMDLPEIRGSLATRDRSRFIQTVKALGRFQLEY